MKAEERRKEIYNIVKSAGEISVSALAQRFCVSTMTIRRDLNTLEASGLIDHTYGKALINDTSKQEFSFEHRCKTNLELKQKIAKTALGLLQNITRFYVDASSTVTELLKLLPPNRSYTIFTNSLEALKILQQRPLIRTFVIGGFLCSDHSTFDDETTVGIAKQIYVDATITSCSCFSKAGIFNDGTIGTQIKRIMINNSTKNFLLADHTKANSQGLFLLNSWDSIQYLITDSPIEKNSLEIIRSYGVQVFW